MNEEWRDQICGTCRNYKGLADGSDWGMEEKCDYAGCEPNHSVCSACRHVDECEFTAGLCGTARLARSTDAACREWERK